MASSAKRPRLSGPSAGSGPRGTVRQVALHRHAGAQGEARRSQAWSAASGSGTEAIVNQPQQRVEVPGKVGAPLDRTAGRGVLGQIAQGLDAGAPVVDRRADGSQTAVPWEPWDSRARLPPTRPADAASVTRPTLIRSAGVIA